MDAWDATPASHRYASRPGEATVLRWLRAGALGAWVVMAFMALHLKTQGNVVLSGYGPLGMTLLVVHGVAVAVALWLHLASRKAVVLTGLPFLAAVVLLLPSRETLLGLGGWAPGMWGLPWLIFTVMVLTRRQYMVFTGVTFAVLAALDLTTTLRSHTVQESVLVTMANYFVVPQALIFTDALVRAAQTSKHTALRRAQAEAQQDHEALVADARREAARLLHDHVLHALHAVSRTSPQVTRDMVREECRTAVAAIAQSTDPHETTARLEEVITDDPMIARVGAHLRGSTDPLPTTVVIAMAAATHEALGNVERHAKAENVTVRVVQHDSQWVCSVIDDGQGFDAEKLNTRRLGLRRSVHERMEEVGGQASITSAPGQGTTVELRWPADEDPDLLTPEDPAQQVRGQLAVSAWPGLVFSALATGVAAGWAHPLWAGLLSVSLLVFVGFLELQGVGRRQLTVLDHVALLATALVAWGLGLWALRGADPLAPVWISWGAVALVQLVVLKTRLWAALLGLACWLAGSTALLLHFVPGILHDAAAGQLLVQPALRCLALLAGFQVCRNLAISDAQHRRQAEVLRRATARLRMRSHLDQFWSGRVTGEALPLMRDVADGLLDPGNPAVAAEARTIEATLRDELILGPEHTAILSEMARLRRAGWAVNAGLSPENCATQLDLLTSGMERIGPPAAPEQQLTLSATPGRGTLVVLEPSEDQARRWSRVYDVEGAQLVLDPDFARVAVTGVLGHLAPRRVAPDPE